MPGSLESPFFPRAHLCSKFRGSHFSRTKVYFFNRETLEKTDRSKIGGTCQERKKHLRTKMSHFEAWLASQSLSRIPGTIALKFIFHNKLFECSMLFINNIRIGGPHSTVERGLASRPVPPGLILSVP